MSKRNDVRKNIVRANGGIGIMRMKEDIEGERGC